jgi:hypothetical protein
LSSNSFCAFATFRLRASKRGPTVNLPSQGPVRKTRISASITIQKTAGSLDENFLRGSAERPVVLGVEHTDLALLILTLALSMITFTSGRTNMLQGVVHLLLFAAYILLIFQA